MDNERDNLVMATEENKENCNKDCTTCAKAREVAKNFWGAPLWVCTPVNGGIEMLRHVTRKDCIHHESAEDRMIRMTGKPDLMNNSFSRVAMY